MSNNIFHSGWPVLTVSYEVAGVEVDHDDPPGVPDHPEDLVRNVPVVIIHSSCAAVGGDHRGGGGGDGVHHGLAGNVRDIHHHAQPVHLLHHGDPKVGQSVRSHRVVLCW